MNREKELGSLRQLLLRERLVTLIGPGGAGKTRLALKLAENVLRQFADGVSLVELSPVTEPEMLARTIAQAHGIIEDGQIDAITQLVAHFAARQAILVLDNCEHVVEEAAPLVQRLLQECPRLTVLATSRERLGVAGEALWRVQPMEVPAPGREYRPEELARVGAVALFLDRAMRSSPGFEVDSSNSGVISELVRRLDGLPLAVELAAAWTGVLSSEDLLANLSNRFQLLTTKQRSVPSRHRSLRAAIDSSYENLEADERGLFRRLGLFVGGWNLDSMTAVSGIDESEALQLLHTLVDRSLVTAQTLEAGPTRYRMLASLREYALEKLNEAGEALETRNAFCEYFLHLAETANQNIYHAVGATWLAALDVERDNCTAALEMSLDDDPGAAIRLAAALVRYWDVRGLYAEGRLRLSRALDRSTHPPTRSLAEARRGLATMAWAQGDHVTATRQARHALGVSSRLQEPDGEARALQLLAQIRFTVGNLEASTARLQRALRVASGVVDQDVPALCLFRLGLIAMAERRWTDASKLLERSIGINRRTGNVEGVAMGSRNLGLVQLETGLLDQSEGMLRESLTHCRIYGSPIQIAGILLTMAAVASDRGQHQRAARLAGQSAGLRERAGVPISSPFVGVGDRVRRSLESAGASRNFAAGQADDMQSAIRFALNEEPERTPLPADRVPDPAAGAGLTPRQVTVAKLVAEGFKNKEIAARLFISERTAEGHVEQLRNKLGLGTRAQIAAWVTQNLGPPDPERG